MDGKNAPFFAQKTVWYSNAEQKRGRYRQNRKGKVLADALKFIKYAKPSARLKLRADWQDDEPPFR
jgi:uncharacterized protein YgiM (DUF1202 family)